MFAHQRASEASGRFSLEEIVARKQTVESSPIVGSATFTPEDDYVMPGRTQGL